MSDKIEIEITEDGLIKSSTDKVSMPNHANAEMFLREMARLAGGPTERKRKHGHTGHHAHEHEHGGEHHSH